MDIERTATIWALGNLIVGAPTACAVSAWLGAGIGLLVLVAFAASSGLLAWRQASSGGNPAAAEPTNPWEPPVTTPKGDDFL